MAKLKTLQAKRTRYGAYVALYTIIVLAVLAAANWLADENNKSFDTTTNKQFSLSDQTIKTVQNLKKPVYIAYFNQSNSFGGARDLLERYSNLSSKVHVDYVDPDKKPDLAKADGFRQQGGVVVRSGDRTEEAAALSEEGVTGAIIRSIKTTQKTVCFVTGSGELATDDTERGGLSYAKDQLEKNTYKTSTFSLLEKQRVPGDCSVVVVASPRRDYVDTTTAALNAYVSGGGHVLISIGPAVAAPGNQGAVATPNLAKLTSDWGVTLDEDLIVDPGSRLLGFSEAAPLGVKYESQPIVRDLARIATVFPLAQSLTVASGKSAEKLISTSDSSVAVVNPKLPLSVDPSTAKKGPFVVAAAGTVGSGAKQGRFVVVGSGDWLGNGALSIAQVADRDFFLNSINWLSADEDLISIRPKNPEDRRVSLTNTQSRMMFLSSVIFLPLLTIISGVAVWAKRR